MKCTADYTIFDDMTATAVGTHWSFRKDCFKMKENCITFVLAAAIGVALDAVGLI